MEEKRSNCNFFTDGGKAGDAIYSADWAEHPLGPPEKWPASLRASLNIILYSNFPMLLFWGPDLFCFYNDAFIFSLDSKNKYFQNIGERAEKIWAETWDTLKSSIDRVFREEKAVTYEDYLLPVFYNSICLSPVKDEENTIMGVLAICKEATSAIMAEQELKELYEEKNRILENITDGFYTLNEDWIITHWNPEAEKLLNIKRNDILGENIWDAFPEGKKLKFYPEFKKSMNERVPASFEEYYEPWGKWFNFNVYPSTEGISVYFKDITEQRRLQLINERTEEISGVAGWELDLATQKVFMTPRVYEIYGLPENTSVDQEINKELYDEKSLRKIEEAVHYAVDRQKPYEIELNLIAKDTENKIIRINGFPLVKDGKVTKVYGTLEDVTQEKNEKKKLEELIRKLKTAQKIAKLGYWIHDIVENKGDWSEEVFNIWEVDPKTFVPNFENLLSTIHPEDREIFLGDANTAFPGHDYYDSEHRIITPDGTVKWILERITLHRDENGGPKLLEGIAQDITEKKMQEEEILQTLQEKETLLAEVHHRVKNNLAVISSMIHLQVYEEVSEETKEKLMDSVVRIISMASIHEQLYQSNSFSKLDLSESLKKQVTQVIRTLDYKVSISLDFKLDRVELNINQAIPCSLIVNEIVTNVIKHAFQGRSKGKILVTLTEEKNRVKLTVKDNGVGMPEDFDVTKDKTLGLNLIDTLARQLNADYRYDSITTGTSFSLQFEKTEIKGGGNANI